MTSTAAIKLTLTIHGGTPRAIEAGPVVLVGSGRGADVRVPDAAIAPLHARLARVDGRIVLLAAAAGLTVDGAAVAIDEPVAVGGRVIAIGPLTIVAAPWE
ncbi:MAG TPA: FHA domain-containing protein, partial [Kofleriaceae bacterium]|nr:FHA domain-containing protein [Kofleriaceae bacterium]